LTNVFGCGIVSNNQKTEKEYIMTQRDKNSKGGFKNIDARADKLLAKRGISGHVAADRFCDDFKAYLCYYATKSGILGSAEQTLSLLEDDANLVNSDIFNKNFRTTFEDLTPDILLNDAIFPKFFKQLLGNNGKGIGIGELVLPLIINKYYFSVESDGKFANGAKVEIKKDGASVKPVKKGLTDQGLVDKLNEKYFKGTVPGMKLKKLFDNHVSTVTDPKVYADYFKELYVGCDTTELAKEVATCYTNPTMFNNAVGKFALKNYQLTDGWKNIFYINDVKMTLVNIADVEDIDGLDLKFDPKFKRGKDTQAISDGYVNVRI
tara:strand:- start:978 stop:1940 length:963 start_codon:yes stop_codon:yes gene_type:complete